MTSVGSQLLFFNLFRLREKGVKFKDAIRPAAVSGLVANDSLLLGTAVSAKLNKTAIATASTVAAPQVTVTATPASQNANASQLAQRVSRLEDKVDRILERLDQDARCKDDTPPSSDNQQS